MIASWCCTILIQSIINLCLLNLPTQIGLHGSSLASRETPNQPHVLFEHIVMAYIFNQLSTGTSKIHQTKHTLDCEIHNQRCFQYFSLVFSLKSSDCSKRLERKKLQLLKVAVTLLV